MSSFFGSWLMGLLFLIGLFIGLVSIHSVCTFLQMHWTFLFETHQQDEIKGLEHEPAVILWSSSPSRSDALLETVLCLYIFTRRRLRALMCGTRWPSLFIWKDRSLHSSPVAPLVEPQCWISRSQFLSLLITIVDMNLEWLLWLPSSLTAAL